MSGGSIAALVLGGLTLVWLIATFNRLVGLRQHLKESWADIDVELKRRHELIPNLVETVKGYAAHERTVLDRVLALRVRAMTDHRDVSALAADESALMRGVRDLFAVVENYPTLKADRHFLALQTQLALTEDRIAAARRFYNGNVRDYTVLRQSFPPSLVASVFRFTEPVGYFELASDAERVVPRVGV